MECELPRGDCCVEQLGRHYGDSGEGLGRDCGETGERLEWNMEWLVYIKMVYIKGTISKIKWQTLKVEYIKLYGKIYWIKL